MSFRFGNPEVFLYFPVIGIFAAVLIFARMKAMEKLAKALGQKSFQILSSGYSFPRRKMKWALRSIGFSFCLLGLARPQSGKTDINVKSQGIELVAMMDVSDSMMAEDLKPNRLTQAKVDLSKLIERLQGSQIGIIGFAGSAAILSPLTNDPGALRMYIDSLSPQSVSSQGTEFASALTEAKEAFQRGGTSEIENQRATRVILVFSDGEDHEPGALDQAKRLVAENYRIFTIAYGTEKGGMIPERDAQGNLRGYKKDAQGQPVLTQVKGKFLEQLAVGGGGKFFFASTAGDHLRGLVEDLDRLEKAEFDSKIITSYNELFQWFLLFGLLCFALDLLVSEVDLRRRQWKGRIEVMP